MQCKNISKIVQAFTHTYPALLLLRSTGVMVIFATPYK